ncbi:MAG: Kdo domain containing protein [Flavobacteriaceae bacterium]
MQFKKHYIFNKNQNEIDINQISDLITNFDKLEGEEGERNTIKKVSLDGIELNIKSFKIPHIINSVVYSIFRKSKANRSFFYANKLLSLDIKTPIPIAYFEFSKFIFLRNSYYVSKDLDYLLLYRDLVLNENYLDYDTILRQFTQFTFDLHEKGINFLDHSPGNTLITKNPITSNYEFYLVDLNRMKFQKMDYNERIKNFAKLTHKKSMVKIMANEYAKLLNIDESKVFNDMWGVTEAFQKKYYDKIALKRRIFFWKDKYKNP